MYIRAQALQSLRSPREGQKGKGGAKWGAGEVTGEVTGEECRCNCSQAWLRAYREIQIISPGLIFVQKAVLLSLFSEEFQDYYWKEFSVSKGVWLVNKNSLKQLPLTVHGLIFGTASYRKDFCA